MWGQIEGKPKIQIARRVIANVLEQWDESVEIGLIAYGHRREGDCDDIEVLRPVASLDQKAYMASINGLNPRGKTPITAALHKAAEELGYVKSRSSVILVSDGLETCGADPCQIATEVALNGIDFTVHVVGFGVTEQESTQLQCIAENTGGQYLGASTAS